MTESTESVEGEVSSLKKYLSSVEGEVSSLKKSVSSHESEIASLSKSVSSRTVNGWRVQSLPGGYSVCSKKFSHSKDDWSALSGGLYYTTAVASAALPVSFKKHRAVSVVPSGPDASAVFLCGYETSAGASLSKHGDINIVSWSDEAKRRDLIVVVEGF